MRTKWQSILALLAAGLFGAGGCSTTQSLGTQVDDTTITSKLDAKMIGDPNVNLRDVSVQTSEGVVTLTGRVATPAERSQAERLARDTTGVRGVRNMIQVGPQPTRP